MIFVAEKAQLWYLYRCIIKYFYMKKIISFIGFLTLAGATLLFVGCDGESYPNKLSVYPFETAVIQYELSGNTEGDQSLFIRGDEKAVSTFVTTPDKESRTFELYLGSTKYIANLDKMTAVKAPNTQYTDMLELDPEEQEAYLIKKSLGLKESAELPEPVITSTVAGHECEVYEIPNVGSACIWNGIVLQKEVTLAGITNKATAVNVSVDVDIPSERFELPAGVIVTNN